MNLRKHIKDYFWSYAAIGGVLGWAWLEMEGEPEYAAHPYPMDLKVWLCGICHHVYDEEEEAEECCPDFKVGDIEGERDWWAEEWNAESFEAEEVAIAVEKTSGGDTLYGIEYLDLGYEHSEWFMSKTDRDLHLDMYIEGNYEYEAESFGGIVACKQENCPHGHCPRCGNCDDVLDNDGEGSEHDDNPMFCGACGESFSAESFQAPLFPKRKLRRSLRNACERCGDEGYRKSGINNTQCERCNRWVHNCCLLPSHDQHGEDVVSCQDCAENFASVVLPPVQTEGIVDSALMHHYLQQRSILEENVRYLEQELMAGRITRKQFAMKLLELENRFSSEEEPKRKGIVRYMRGVPVKPRKLNGDPHPAEAAQKIDIGAKKPVEAIEVTWDSDNKPETEDPFSEVKWEAESMKKVGEHRVGRVIVEDCVDIRANKADAVGRYYRMRFRDPDDFENFRVPAWASRAANTIGRKYYDVLGSKITMGQTKGGEWMIQSVMVPRIPRLTPDGALVIANHIQDRIEREGQWAKADCQDEERVLMVS